MSTRTMRACALSLALLTGFHMMTDAHAQDRAPDIRFAGALEFSDDGTLFVGDNHGSAIFAFEIEAEPAEGETQAATLGNIDVRIADLLGVGIGALQINDLAVHPVSREVYISVARIASFMSQPAIVAVSRDQQLRLLDLDSLPFQKAELSAFPGSDATFGVRGTMGTVQARDTAKGDISVRSLAIMDMEFYGGELFVSGVAHEDFLSSLRRISYPFDGSQSIATVGMYHIAHDNYESRAPIRAMSIQEIDGAPQLVAAYTCSPVVLIPLDEIRDGASITARTIIDMGNGQPLDMVPFSMEGEPALFVTSNSRSPQVIPVSGLQKARVVTRDDFERGPKLDLHPLMPFGPAGKAVMFDGVPLHLAAVDEHFFVSLTRDAYTGSLNMDINPSAFPNRMHNFYAEFDLPARESTDVPSDRKRKGRRRPGRRR